jgi:hypothetical protein
MRRILLLTIAAVLGTAAPAAGQATSTATPDGAGEASKLKFDIDGLAAPIAGRLPSALQLTAPEFRTDLTAARKRCSESAAQLNECPRSSLIGKGVLVVGVADATGTRDARIDVNVYLSSKTKILAVAYVFGWQIVPATLDTAAGFDVRFDPLPTGVSFPNVTFTLKQISFEFAAKRVIKQRTVRRAAGKRRVITRKRRAQLIRNPRTCNGSWPSSVTLTFRDASVLPLAAPTLCSPK